MKNWKIAQKICFN